MLFSPQLPRFPLAGLAVLLFASPAVAQSNDPGAALKGRPAAPIPAPSTALPLDASATDSLTDEQLALRIARLYTRQAGLLEAEAAGNSDRYERLLEGLVRDVLLLSELPGVSEAPRFREVYTSVLTEYEQFYDDPALDRGEIFPFLEEAFAAIAVDEPLLENVELPSFSEGNYTAVFPMEVNNRVERSISFLQRARTHVSTLRSRADTYFPMVERVLAEEGVPDELKYLAMVESALNPRARSHAGAGGMWQFIPATGRAYDLRVNREVDDRLNPERATRAAARHLRDLYARFGDWQLALAGYNCNPNKIQREVERAERRLGRKATFWDIYNHIPRETRGYVPMFIATSLVLSNPVAYGLPTTAETGPRYVFDTVPVSSGTPLGAIASVLGVNDQVLRALNPSIRGTRIPTQREPWMLRIPAGHYDRFADNLSRFAPRSVEDQTLYAAQTVNYGTRAYRPLAPGSGTQLTRASQPQATRSATPAKPATPVRTVADVETREAPPAAPRVTTHRVRRGETLSGIASSYGTTVRQLMNTNGLRSTRIRSGQRLRVRGGAAAPAAKTTTHRVRRGETLSGIAAQYGTTVRQLKAANNLRSSTIRSGQRLRVDGSSSGSASQTVTHRVRSGQNLIVIARRYGVTVQQIMNWNNLRSTTIRPGQRLRIETRRRVG